MLRLLLAALLLLCMPCMPPAGAEETTRDPSLLVASPELQDPNFAESVVLVVYPRKGGPVGVILNRPTRITLKEAFANQPHLRDREDKLYFGGPVRLNALMFLFRRVTGGQGAFPVLDDLYLSDNGELLDQLLAANESSVQRYFLGYAGWAPVQLDAEIAEGAWYVLPADVDTVLQMDTKTMWRALLARATAVKI